MERVRLIYEQIEEAKKYLLSGSMLHLRLALILLDNAAELMMYNTLQYQFGWDDLLTHKKPKYTKKERLASEKEFEVKLRILCISLERITVEEKEILCICHRLRCGAFHRGHLRHEMLRSICTLLYVTVANLSVKLKFRSYTISGGPEGSPEDRAFLQRFGIDNSYSLGSEEALVQLMRKLLEEINFNPHEIGQALSQALSNDLVNRIDNTLEDLRFLQDTTDEAQIDHNLQYGQFWYEVGAQMMNEGHSGDSIHEAFAQWKSAGRAKVTLSALKQWRTHALAIARQRKPGAALTRFWTIDKKFGVHESGIRNAVARKEDEIDAEIDHIRSSR